jgi:D-alanine-D-alanine ligase
MSLPGTETAPESPPKSGRVAARSKPKPTTVLGPVEDLESYVKADWWRHIFNAHYLRTDGDVVEDDALTDRELDLVIETLRPDPDAAILDLCCGQGRHCLGLARRGFSRVTGMDRSHYLVTRARQAAKRDELGVSFREGDARRLRFETDSFDFVLLLGNSFGYFESRKNDVAVLAEIRRVLKPTGRLLLDLTDGDWMRAHFEPRSWEWIDRNWFVCRERSVSGDGDRLVTREVITHVRKGVVNDQFYAERLYNSETMQSLLKECGFTGIDTLEPFTTESRRNQDLGMMGRRLVHTAKPEKTWSTPRRRSAAQAVRTVAVAMGDPRKSDKVKLNGTFNEADFETIGRLRQALGSIPGYRFSFFDNHDTLLADLRRIRAEHDFVFNLCDEGFGNLATWELHVPALLEVHGIPYTGGNPQCLAYCYDKSLVRGVANELDLPVPAAFVIKPEDTNFLELPLPFPVIVKPNFGDSSFGITARSVCENLDDLQQAIVETRDRFGYGKPILIEQFLTGKDVTVGIIGNPPDSYTALPIIEEDYSRLPPGLPRLCGYEAKWDPTSPYWTALRSIPAELPEDTEGYLVTSCLRLFERLDCRDYARFDWRLDHNGTPRLLEVNPNPGWCWDGHLAKMAALAGHDYPAMLQMILQAAEERLRRSGQVNGSGGRIQSNPSATTGAPG